MKKIKILSLFISFILSLSACSVPVSPEQNMQKIRKFLYSYKSINLTADITADYGDKIFTYSVKYSGSDEDGVIEITAPDSIAGLHINVSSEDGIKLEYDGAVLDTGKLYEDGLSPVDAIPVLLSQWEQGYISECSSERHDGINCTAATIIVSDSVFIRTWFDCDSYLPLYAEISNNGFVIIKCNFKNISMN